MAKGNRSGSAVTAPTAIHELELALLREQNARGDWNLPLAAQELVLMQKIRQKAGWPAEFAKLLPALDSSLEESLETVRTRDTTRIQAAHTRLQRAIFALRDLMYA
jgi:hypothetical protein